MKMQAILQNLMTHSYNANQNGAVSREMLVQEPMSSDQDQIEEEMGAQQQMQNFQNNASNEYFIHDNNPSCESQAPDASPSP
jgi:hypothetical protein